MENIDQSTLDQLFNRTTTNLIPESLISTLTTTLIALVILGAVFVILYLIGTVRKWQMQSAVLTMQKDVSEIKQLLSSNSARSITPPKETATADEQPAQA